MSFLVGSKELMAFRLRSASVFLIIFHTLQFFLLTFISI
jgi:hypothetical protein